MLSSDVFALPFGSLIEWGHHLFYYDESPWAGTCWIMRSTATYPDYRVSRWNVHINRGPAFLLVPLFAVFNGSVRLATLAECRRVTMEIAAFEQDLLVTLHELDPCELVA